MQKDAILDPTTYVTRRETAAYLRVSQATLHRWMKLNIGPPFVRFVEDGRGRILYPRAGVIAYGVAHTVHPKCEAPAPAGRRQARRPAVEVVEVKPGAAVKVSRRGAR